MTTPKKQKRSISRHDFLRLSALGAGGTVLAACTPPAPTAAPAAPPKAAEPTKPPAPTAVPPAKEPVTITLMKWGGGSAKDTDVEAWEKGFPEEAKMIKCNVVSPGASDVNTNQALRLALASGSGIPDVFQANYASIPEFAQSGALWDLTDKIKPYLNDISAGGSKLMQFKGKYVTTPKQPKPKLWFYRKDNFDKAGIDPAKVKTFEDYMAAGAQFKKAITNSNFMNIGPQPIHYWWMMFYSHWDDFKLADENGKWYINSDPRFAQVLDWMKQMFKADFSIKIDDYATDWEPAFNDGKISGWLCASWGINNVNKMAPKQSGLWKITLWPEFSQTGSEAGGGTHAIPVKAKYREEAWKVLSALTFTEHGGFTRWQGNQAIFPVYKPAVQKATAYIKSGERPAGMTDANYELYAPKYYGADYIDAYFKSLDVMKVPPYDPSFQAELVIIRAHTEAYFADKETLKQAVEGIQSDCEKQIGNPYKI